MLLSIVWGVSAAQQTAHYVHFNNQAQQIIYVWVIQAVNVIGPQASKPPYLALVLKPHTGNVKLRYVVTLWNADTIFGLAFCQTSDRSCINTGGAYAALTIVPASKTQWKVAQRTTSGMTLSLPPVVDNVSHHSGTTWPRNADFPYEIKFWNNRAAVRD